MTSKPLRKHSKSCLSLDRVKRQAARMALNIAARVLQRDADTIGRDA